MVTVSSPWAHSDHGGHGSGVQWSRLSDGYGRSMKTISCHQSWLATWLEVTNRDWRPPLTTRYPWLSMLSDSWSTARLGQPIRRARHPRPTTRNPWLTTRDSRLNSWVTSHESLLATCDWWLKSPKSRIASDESRVVSRESRVASPPDWLT